MLTQQCLPPPLTSSVKSSLFTHSCSSPLSLVARLHRCGANHSYFVNNDWTFSRQTTYTYTCIYLYFILFFGHLERKSCNSPCDFASCWCENSWSPAFEGRFWNQYPQIVWGISSSVKNSRMSNKHAWTISSSTLCFILLASLSSNSGLSERSRISA